VSGAVATGQWGAFRIGVHEFALPIENLIEVAPGRDPVQLPDVPSFVRGACLLRGVLVPVVDLRPRLGLPAAAGTIGLVLVVHLGEHAVGLEVDAVTGTFGCAANDFHSVHGDASTLVVGCLAREPGRLVSALSIDALAALPGLPRTPWRDRRDAAEVVANAAGAVANASDAVAAAAVSGPTESLLLLQSGGLRFAVDSLRVQSTLWEPQLLDSPLIGGACRGEVAHRGRSVPALELNALLGFAVPAGGGPRQAFVVDLPQGMVVFLVDRVAEILPVARAAIRPVPPFAFPATRQLRGVCRLAGDGDADHLVLDLDALLAIDDVQKLAGMNGAVRGRGPIGSSADDELRAAANGRRLATFALGGDFAVPLEQLAEVLPCPPTPPTFGDDSLVQRILVHRDRSIPVVRLARLLVGAPHDVVEACVLVVGSGDRLLGFAVPALQSLEPATWERPMPDSVRAIDGDLRGSGAERTMARLGTGADHRIVEVLDLVAFARRLHGAVDATNAADQPSMPSLVMSAADATSATVPAGCA